MRITTRKGIPVAVVGRDEAQGMTTAQFDAEVERLGYERRGPIQGKTDPHGRPKEAYAQVIRYE